MKVSDIMTRGVISVAPQDSVRKAVELMLRYDISGFPVLDRGTLVGMITEGDFMRRAETGTERPRLRLDELLADPGKAADEYAHSHARTVGEVMSRNIVTIGEDALLEEAVELMERHRVKRLPVVGSSGMVGLVSRSNLLHAFLVASSNGKAVPRSDAAIRRMLQAELDRQSWLSQGEVTAAVKKGVVSLKGTICDERQRTALRTVAENIPGVTEVRDDLQGPDIRH